MINPASGTLLIADPFLKDPNFMRSVVLICQHEGEGTFGFVMNRLFDNSLQDLITAAEGLDIPVFYGGPVQTDTIHFLHQYPAKIEGSQKVMEGVYWGGSFETAIDLLRNGEISADKIRFFLGYSGWGEGQLDSEMKEKTWLTVSATRKIIFHPFVDHIWKDSLKLMGGDYQMLINYPIDPQLN
jgi:putative transcriptional regulator